MAAAEHAPNDGARSLVARGDAVAAYLAGFFEIRAPQSMVRLAALLFAVAAVLCALAAYDLTHRPHLTPELVPFIDALSRMAGVFGISGTVALLTRTRANAVNAPGDPQ